MVQVLVGLVGPSEGFIGHRSYQALAWLCHCSDYSCSWELYELVVETNWHRKHICISSYSDLRTIGLANHTLDKVRYIFCITWVEVCKIYTKLDWANWHHMHNRAREMDTGVIWYTLYSILFDMPSQHCFPFLKFLVLASVLILLVEKRWHFCYFMFYVLLSSKKFYKIYWL